LRGGEIPNCDEPDTSGSAAAGGLPGHADSGQHERVHAPQARPTVLIVDEDEASSRALLRVLTDVEVLATKSALEALRLMAQRPIDAIVCAQFLRGMAGTRLLELAFERIPEAARMLLTAQYSTDVLLAAVNHGRVNRVLLKQLSPLILREQIVAAARVALQKRASSERGMP
jgi:response regulator RpfG family c-di-GMP phosphodiesterase